MDWRELIGWNNPVPESMRNPPPPQPTPFAHAHPTMADFISQFLQYGPAGMSPASGVPPIRPPIPPPGGTVIQPAPQTAGGYIVAPEAMPNANRYLGINRELGNIKPASDPVSPYPAGRIVLPENQAMMNRAFELYGQAGKLNPAVPSVDPYDIAAALQRSGKTANQNK